MDQDSQSGHPFDSSGGLLIKSIWIGLGSRIALHLTVTDPIVSAPEETILVRCREGPQFRGGPCAGTGMWPTIVVRKSLRVLPGTHDKEGERP